jgi:hypothetical protein
MRADEADHIFGSPDFDLRRISEAKSLFWRVEVVSAESGHKLAGREHVPLHGCNHRPAFGLGRGSRTGLANMSFHAAVAISGHFPAPESPENWCNLQS